MNDRPTIEVIAAAERARADVILKEVGQWFEHCLGCVAGKREQALGRYVLAVVDSEQGLDMAFGRLLAEMGQFKATAAMIVFDDPEMRALSQHASASEIVHAIADRTATLGDMHDVMLRERSLTRSLVLKCPVTECVTTFTDLDVMPFCPQAANVADAHYNPSVEAPYPCVNITSDVFAFGMFVRDTCLRELGMAPKEVGSLERLEPIFEHCAALWQRFALKSMRNYASRTNAARLCPISVTPTQQHWVGAHEEAAFFNATMPPIMYMHEMPTIYTHRIISQWRQHFTTSAVPSYRGMTIKGSPCPHLNSVQPALTGG